MAKEPFSEMDASFMKRLKKMREKNVPPAILKNFSASVEARIREKERQKISEPAPRRFGVPVWVPAFAVLVLASLVVLRIGTSGRFLPFTPSQSVPAGSLEISKEIALLRELGAWTEEDEKAVGITDENSLEELETSLA